MITRGVFTRSSDQSSSVARMQPGRTRKPSIIILLSVFQTYLVIRCILTAKAKPLFYDEILTFTVAKLPSVRSVWQALAHAVDTQPPLFYLIEHVAMDLIQNMHIALRLPSILAMGFTSVCVFIYAKKQSGEWAALLFSLLLFSTPLFHEASIDARPYSLFVACIAFALVCHQRLPSLLWAGLMAIALALAQSLHYYAILGLFTFGLSEGALLIVRRSFRWQVWLALAVAALPLPFLWPLLASVKAYYGSHFWSHYTAGDLPRTYGNFLMTSAAFGVAIAAVCVAGVLTLRFWQRSAGSVQDQNRDQSFAEAILLLSLLLLPLFAFVVLRLAHAGMVDRYVFETILAIPLTLPFVFRNVQPRGVSLLAVFVFFLVGLHEISFWRSNHSFQLAPQAAPVESLVQDAGQPDLPVIVSAGLTYVELEYYASASWADRFVYLTDSQQAIQFAGTDSVDKGIQVLRNYMRLRVINLRDFTSGHRTFLLYTQDPPVPFDWLPAFLRANGGSMQLLSQRDNRQLYLVTLTKSGHP